MTTTQQHISIREKFVLVERPADYEVLPDDQPAQLMEISAACEEAGCRKVLVIGPKTRVRLSITDIYALGEQISKLGMQVAVVELHDASSDDERFLENVTSNRGRPMQFFRNETDAKSWLGVE